MTMPSNYVYGAGGAGVAVLLTYTWLFFHLKGNPEAQAWWWGALNFPFWACSAILTITAYFYIVIDQIDTGPDVTVDSALLAFNITAVFWVPATYWGKQQYDDYSFGAMATLGTASAAIVWMIVSLEHTATFFKVVAFVVLVFHHLFLDFYKWGCTSKPVTEVLTKSSLI